MNYEEEQLYEVVGYLTIGRPGIHVCNVNYLDHWRFLVLDETLTQDDQLED